MTSRNLDKRTTLGILGQAVDIARQAIWAGAANKKIGKKDAEHLLVNFDAAMRYSHQMLHDILTGKTAQYIEKIDPKSGSVLMGHQAQATYIRLSFENIWDLSVRCWEAEEAYQKQLQEELEIAELNRDIDEGVYTKPIDVKVGMTYRMDGSKHCGQG